MITDAILSFIFGAISFLMALLPAEQHFPSYITTSADYIGGFPRMFSPILPYDAVFNILLLIISVQLVFLSIRAVTWVYHKIRP